MFKKHRRYSVYKKIRKSYGERILLVSCVFAVSGGLYLLLLTYSPRLEITQTIFSPKLSKVEADEFVPKEDTIMIDKIGVVVPFSSEGEQALEGGLWHRKAENGNPEDGGNFVLAGHRSFIGVTTPQEIIKRSPLYNIHKLNGGDSIRVYFDEKWYDYEVERRFTVKPHETWIENQTDKHQLTLYSCTFDGPEDGREVVIARLVGIKLSHPTRSTAIEKHAGEDEHTMVD